tara:strand:+ start:73 stop:612 length:540 start_codon:yes stop_codon:yes gene_type:complete
MTENFIFKEESCLSSETCKKLIEFFDKNEFMAKKGDVGNIMFLDDLEIPISVFNSPPLKEGVMKAINKYKNKYSLLETNLGDWAIDDIAYLMRYEPKAHYSYIHCEADGSPTRILAWMIYLNTIKNQGGTEFIYQNTTLIPKEGDMYIWPSGWTHFHRGVATPNERKYIITGWASTVFN